MFYKHGYHVFVMLLEKTLVIFIDGFQQIFKWSDLWGPRRPHTQLSYYSVGAFHAPEGRMEGEPVHMPRTTLLLSVISILI